MLAGNDMDDNKAMAHTPTRLDVQFPSHGAQCRAWLYLPDAPNAPVIVMAHGLGAVRTMRLDAFAERFCQAGYACLVFDYRHFGDSEGTPRQLLDVKKQLQDWHAAIAHVRSRPDVNGRQTVLWGTSFSGGHVIAVGAQDGNVAAVVSQCPFTDGLASALALGPVSGAKVSALAVLDVIGSMFGATPVRVATSGKRFAAALMTAPDAEPGYRAIMPTGQPIPNWVAARFGLQILTHYPGRRAADLRCPSLFCVCDKDSVAPSGATLKHLRKAPQATIKTYPEGHFDIYVGQAFERVVADQIAFLHRTVPPAGHGDRPDAKLA